MMSEKSLRDALEESFDAAEESEDVEEESVQEEAPEEEVPESGDGGSEGGDESGDPAEGGEESDDSPDEVPDTAASDESEDEPDEEEQGEEIPAPVSWRPAVRELWGKLPADVKAEVQKREKEVEKGLRQAAGYRQVAEEYQNVIKPYENLIRQAGGTPAGTVNNLLQTAARLTQGNQVEKANVVKEIIQGYRIDIQTLDKILSEADLPSSDYSPVIDHIDQRLAPINQFMNEFQGQTQQAEQEGAEMGAQELESFAQTHEFFWDVKDDMADIMELAGRRNREMTLEQAYEKACSDHEEISRVIAQRNAAQRARPSGHESGRKRHAASSVPSSTPTPSASEQGPKDRRGAIASLWDEAESGPI
jgi:hypothetical protein